MKKLLTILAATATMFASGFINADALPTGTSFEGLQATNLTWNALIGRDDTGDPTGSLYWYASPSDFEDEVGVITNYDGNAYTGARPKKFENAAQNNFLSIETQTPLFRTVYPYNGEGGTQQVAIAEGIYLDTLIKFTAADEAFGENDLNDGDKIAISYVEHEDDDMTPENEAYTNFVVRAGFVDGNDSQTNYFAAVPAGFDKDAWHRLTVRAISNVGGGVGFVVYLDGDMTKMLTYSTNTVPGTATYVSALAANSLVAEYFYNDNVHAIFPSAIRSGDDATTISAVAFSGNGSIDDLTFTDEKPSFITESMSVTVTWEPEKVTEVKLNSDDPVSAQVLANGSTTVEPTNGVVSVSVKFVDGYVMGVGSVENGKGGWNGSNAFTNLSAGATCNIVSMQPLYSVGDKYFEDVEAAIAEAEATGTSASSPATLKLLADVSKSITIGNEAYVIIDLNGKTITGDADSGAAIVNGGATLTITNSAVTVGHVVPYEDGYLAVLLTSGTATYITAGSFDGPVDFDGFDTDYGDVFVITGGSFLDVSAAGVVAEFYLKEYVEQGLDVTADGDYFQVGESGGGDTPTEIDVPTAASNLVYDGTEKTGVAAGDGYTLTGVTAATNAGEYTATATLEEGYVWSDTTTEAKSINWSIAPKTDAAVVVTLTSEIAEYSAQLEFPTATATIGGVAVEGTTNWVENAISEPEAGATNTYTVTFTVTTANYAGSTGTATFKVWKAAAGKTYPSYIEGDTAKDKYDAWATANNISASDFPDTGNAYQDAYLLNCAPDAAVVAAEKAAFKFTSISYDTTQSKWVTTTTTQNTSGADYNGTVTVTGYSDVGCTVGNETEAGPFFKATLQ